jgi:hypothetical protein
MIVANSQLVPEFQYWFSRFATTSIVNRYGVPIPVEVPEAFIARGTVVELLCNEDYPYDSYTYLYKNESRKQCWPTLTAQRLNIYPGSQFMIPAELGDEGATNFFNLQDDDFLMLDVLLAYRRDSTAFILIDATSTTDSTAVEVITDATTGITYVYASLDTLSTSLSKEIFLYLQFHLYQNWQLYDTVEIISDDSLLATCFEFKLIDDYFLYMTDRDVGFGIDCD